MRREGLASRPALVAAALRNLDERKVLYDKHENSKTEYSSQRGSGFLYPLFSATTALFLLPKEKKGSTSNRREDVSALPRHFVRRVVNSKYLSQSPTKRSHAHPIPPKNNFDLHKLSLTRSIPFLWHTRVGPRTQSTQHDCLSGYVMRLPTLARPLFIFVYLTLPR